MVDVSFKDEMVLKKFNHFLEKIEAARSINQIGCKIVILNQKQH